MVSRPKFPAGTSVSNSKAVLCAHWSGSRASSVGTRGQSNQADPPTDRTMSFRTPRQLHIDPENRGSTVPEGDTTHPSAAPWTPQTRTRRADPSQAVHTHCCPSGLGTEESAPQSCPGQGSSLSRAGRRGTGRNPGDWKMPSSSHGTQLTRAGEWGGQQACPTLWAMC